MLVDYSTIAAILFSGILCFLVPIILYILLRRRSKHIIGPVIAGALAFYIMQVVIRIPLLQYVVFNSDFFEKLKENPILLGLFLGFTAALFETVGRFITMNFLLKKRASYHTGIAHGIGHGGIEAILFVGINYIAYIYFSYLINTIGVDAFIAKVGGGNQIAITQLNYLSDMLINEQPYIFIIAGVERVLAIICHIGFSVLMMEGIVKNKKLLYFVIVIALHTLLDFGAVVLSANNIPIYLIEGFIFIFAIIMLIYIIKSKRCFGDKIESKIENAEYIYSDY